MKRKYKFNNNTHCLSFFLMIDCILLISVGYLQQQYFGSEQVYCTQNTMDNNIYFPNQHLLHLLSKSGLSWWESTCTVLHYQQVDEKIQQKEAIIIPNAKKDTIKATSMTIATQVLLPLLIVVELSTVLVLSSIKTSRETPQMFHYLTYYKITLYGSLTSLWSRKNINLTHYHQKLSH